MTTHGNKKIRKIVVGLVAFSIPFSAEPMTDDEWKICVEVGNKDDLVRLIKSIK